LLDTETKIDEEQVWILIYFYFPHL